MTERISSQFCPLAAATLLNSTHVCEIQYISNISTRNHNDQKRGAKLMLPVGILCLEKVNIFKNLRVLKDLCNLRLFGIMSIIKIIDLHIFCHEAELKCLGGFL